MTHFFFHEENFAEIFIKKSHSTLIQFCMEEFYSTAFRKKFIHFNNFSGNKAVGKFLIIEFETV